MEASKGRTGEVRVSGSVSSGSRFRPAIFAALALIAVASVIGAAPSSAAPVNLTNWSPAIEYPSAAGRHHALAINPSSGRQLIFGYARAENDDPAEFRLFSKVVAADGSPVAGPTTLASDSSLRSNQGFGAEFNPGTGGWIISYFDASLDVVVRFLDAEGSPEGPPLTLNTFKPDGAYVNGTALAYDSRDERFLVGWTYYADEGQPVGRFVSATGTVQGASEFELVGDPESLLWLEYRQVALAYSPEQDGFGLTMLAQPVAGGSKRPWFQLLGPDGTPVGNQQTFPSNEGPPATNPDVAYNPARDEYGVVWVDQNLFLSPSYPALVQRVRADDGTPVGGPVTQSQIPTEPAGSRPMGYRAHIAAHPTADHYYITTYAERGACENCTDSINGWELAGEGTQDLSSLGWVISPPSVFDAVRPQVEFSAYDCTYAVTAIGSTEGQLDYNVYGSKVQAEAPCVPPSNPELAVSISGAKKVRAGKSFKVGIQSTNRQILNRSAAARSGPAESVTTCLALPRTLFIARANGASTNAHRACWTRGTLAVGSSVTYLARIRVSKTAAATRAVARLRGSVTASGESGDQVTASGDRQVRILPARVPRPRPSTG